MQNKKKKVAIVNITRHYIWDTKTEMIDAVLTGIIYTVRLTCYDTPLEFAKIEYLDKKYPDFINIFNYYYKFMKPLRLSYKYFAMLKGDTKDLAIEMIYKDLFKTCSYEEI